MNNAVDTLKINVKGDNGVEKNQLFLILKGIGYMYMDIVPNSNYSNIGIYLISNGEKKELVKFSDKFMKFLESGDKDKFKRVLTKMTNTIHHSLLYNHEDKCINHILYFLANIMKFYCM